MPRPKRITMTINSVQKVVSLLSAKITRSMTQPTLMNTKRLIRSPSTQQYKQISLRIPRSFQHRQLQMVHHNPTLITYLAKKSSRAPRKDTFVDQVKYKFKKLETLTTSAVARTSQRQQATMKLSWSQKKRAPTSTHLSRSTTL